MPRPRAGPSEDGGHRQSATHFQFGSAKTLGAIATTTVKPLSHGRVRRIGTPDNLPDRRPDNRESRPIDQVATGPHGDHQPPRRHDMASPREALPPTGPSFSTNSSSPERTPPPGSQPTSGKDALEHRMRLPASHPLRKPPLRRGLERVRRNPPDLARRPCDPTVHDRRRSHRPSSARLDLKVRERTGFL
jgi:hypothetical protein